MTVPSSTSVPQKRQTKKRQKSRLDKEKAHIAIIGSGLAGLSAAISLEQAGFQRVSVYELDADFETQKEGFGMTLTYNPKGPLALLGVLEQVAQQDCPSRSHYVFRVSQSIASAKGEARRSEAH
jgi:2-polyprenyl-6-methoxyphenol hydroxylase-like FAD-dependent oxidoreductase